MITVGGVTMMVRPRLGLMVVLSVTNCLPLSVAADYLPSLADCVVEARVVPGAHAITGRKYATHHILVRLSCEYQQQLNE